MAVFRDREAKSVDSPRTIWGRVLYDLKEARQYELHSICVNLDRVALNGDCFVITVFDAKIFNLLQNNKELVASFKRVGYNYYVSVVLGESKQEKLNKKLAQLQNNLGYDVKIKQGD